MATYNIPCFYLPWVKRERERKECVYFVNGDEKQSNLCKKKLDFALSGAENAA